MCVIIFVPQGQKIDENEIREAWTTNPDGAGFSIQKDGKVFFKRGFMNLENYIEEVMPLVGDYNLMLHFRISTSKSVNKVQTHPYKKGNVTITEGITTKPVICMNGIISGQREYKNCNDTMSYIIDHQQAFANINQDILNIIEDATGAKWAVMLPDEVLLSSKFQEENGRFYSNKNHLYRRWYYTYKPATKTVNRHFNNMIKGKNLKKSIRRDKDLYEDVMEFIDIWCNSDEPHACDMCTKCLRNAKTLRDVKITLNENFYYFDQYELEEVKEENACCLYDDLFYDYYNYQDGTYSRNYLFDE